MMLLAMNCFWLFLIVETGDFFQNFQKEMEKTMQISMVLCGFFDAKQAEMGFGLIYSIAWGIADCGVVRFVDIVKI